MSEETKRAANEIYNRVRAYDRLIEIADNDNDFDLSEKLTASQEKLRAELRSLIF